MELSALREVLKEFTLKDALAVEDADPQMEALRKLFASAEDREEFFKLVLTNALLSYQLPVRGEKYWENFAEFFSKGKTLDDFGEFLKIHNARFLEAKLKRLQKVLRVVKKLSERELKEFCSAPERLAELLASSLGQKITDKTILFAVKMFLYACRVAGKEGVVAPFELGVPLDSRLKKISADPEFWNTLAREVNIPPLHLDAIIWTTMGASERKLVSLEGDIGKKLIKLKKVLKTLIRRS
jgi:DNA-(apurinic or apyrimidinic site) lyase